VTVLLLAVLASFLIGVVVVLRSAEQSRLRASLVAYAVTFPRGLEDEAVQQLLTGVSGLLPPWWRRWLASPVVIFEIEASDAGIHHQVLVPRAWHAVLENELQACVPGVRYERLAALAPLPRIKVAAEYHLNTSQRALRVEPDQVAAKLLSSMQPVRVGEAIVVQWIVTPAPPVSRVRPASPRDRSAGVPIDSEAAAALKAKYAHPLLLATARVGVTARDVRRARHLLRHAEVGWHGTRAPGVQLSRRVLPQQLVAGRVARRALPWLIWPSTFNTQELSGLIGWPVGAAAIPGLPLGSARLLPASPWLATAGTVVGDSTFPGDERPLALTLEARLRHLHVIGPTGTGKSHLLCSLVLQDLAAGHGVVLLDPKGDLVADVLAHMPAERIDDAIVLDPADESRPVGLNPLRAAHGASAEVVVENLTALFRSLYRSSWGPRTDDILRAALLTLSSADDATLCEVPLLLTDATFRRRLVAKIDDPVGLESFWGWYEGLSDGERVSVVGPVLNKVRAFTMRPRVRSIIGQSQPRLNLREVLRDRKVLLVSLGVGLLGEEAAALLGALLVAELWHATTARAGITPERRLPVMAYLDEWQHFLHLPTPMASVLAEARGLGLGLTLAHQHLGQLSPETRDAVLANARSRVVFQVPSSDARLLAREMNGLVTADDLTGLPAFEIVAQLFSSGSTQPPATARTRQLPIASADTDQVRSQSRERYGVDRQTVETAIRSRQSVRLDAPVRRRPTRSEGRP